MHVSGLASNILTELDKNHETLLKWLDETTSGVSGWLPCYSAAGTDMNVTRFHSGCDYRGPTVTLVKVNDYIFGGFSSENWGGIILSKLFFNKQSSPVAMFIYFSRVIRRQVIPF